MSAQMAQGMKVGPTTLERCTQTIQLAEEEEEGLSDNEYAEIGTLLSEGNSAVTYLAFRRKGVRSAWL